MAERKTNRSTSSKKGAGKQLELSENAKVKKKIKELKKQQDRESTLLYNLMPGILGFAAVLSVICLAINPESLGFLRYFIFLFKGLFSHAVWLIPACLAIEAYFWKQDYLGFKVTKKVIYAFCTILFFTALLQLILSIDAKDLSMNPVDLFCDALIGKSAGVFGGLIGMLLIKFTGSISWIIAIFGLKIWANVVFNDGTCKTCHEGKYQLIAVDRDCKS